MKTILIATDFSEASVDAIKYGVELAKSLRARVILYNAFRAPIPSPDSPFAINPQTIREKVIKRLNIQSFEIATQNVSVEKYCTEDPPAHGILKAAKKKRADIIIAGMKASGKAWRMLFGSTVTSLARITDIPLLVVPESTEFSQPEVIGVAYDLDIAVGTNVHFLDSLSEIAGKFEAGLYFVKVVRDKSSQAFKSLPLPFRLNSAIDAVDTRYDFLEGKNVAHTLEKFTRHRKIDILTILPHRHSFFYSLFNHSTTRETLFETPVPLLILPEARSADDITLWNSFSNGNREN